MEIKVLPLGLIGANCYMIKGKMGAVLIDTGAHNPALEEFLKENQDKERLILLTHPHFDHIGGALELREKTGVKIAIGKNDAEGLLDQNINLSKPFHINLEPFSADITFCDGEEFSVGDLKFKVIETPGHTKGSMCYLIEDCLFSGDTLFEGSVGRTDFPGGDIETLNKSLRKLMGFEDSIKVFSGHGDATTIGRERNSNPFLKG